MTSTKQRYLDKWLTEEDFSRRDALSRQLVDKGFVPTETIKSVEKEAGIYPDVENTELPRKLFYKKEFYDARAEAFSVLKDKGDQCSAAAFEAFTLTPVQRLVSRFLHPSTPYLGLLLYHGVGVGKTCSAVSIAENFLAERPNKRVHIIVPRSIAPGFRRTIFNPDVLRKATPDDPARYVRGGWYSAQCTGTTYLDLVDATAEDEPSKIIFRIDKQKRQRYRINGYMAFKNSVMAFFKERIPASITDEKEIEERRRDLLRELFNDGLIIIDEAHNLRQDPKTMTGDEMSPDENPDAAAVEEGAEAKAIIPLLLDILRFTEGCRIVLMTATPMFNTAPEILFLLNLLILNDTKRLDTLESDELFEKGLLKKEAEQRIQEIASRYVSYMRGENPFTFPVRLRPTLQDDWKPTSSYPSKTALRGGDDIDVLPEVLEGLEALPIQRVRPVSGSVCEKISRFQMNVSAVPTTANSLAAESEEAEDDPLEIGRRKNVLDSWTQIGNLTYKNEQFGKQGWENHFKEEGRRLEWRAENEYGIDDVFGQDALPNHAPKIAKILDYIKTSKGINFVYSRYVQPGALPLCVALERAGYTRVSGAGEEISLLRTGQGTPSVPRQCAMCPRKQHGPEVPNSGPDGCPGFVPARYVLLTSDYTTNIGDTVTYATTFPPLDDPKRESAIRGGKVKVIVGSQIAGEGLDLKCVREIHVLDPWYHLNRLEQIIGRGVRYCSHGALPAELRNCLIHLYSLYYDDYETSDIYSYRLAVQKAKAIGLVQRQLKIGAWDCNLNFQGIQLTGDIKQRHIDAQGNDLGEIQLADKDNSSICDYMECSYTCKLDVRPISENGSDLNTSTFTVRDARSYLLLRESALRQIFSIQPFLPLKQVKEIYKGLPEDVLSAALPTIINNPSFELTHNGQKGYLILRNNYVIFQPKSITDTSVPLALRFRKSDTPLWLGSVRPSPGPFAAPAVNLGTQKRPTGSAAGTALLEDSPSSIASGASGSSDTSGASGSSEATSLTTGTQGTRFTAASSKSVSEKSSDWVSLVLSAVAPVPPSSFSAPQRILDKMKGLEKLGKIAQRFKALPHTKDVLLGFGLDHFYSTETMQDLLTKLFTPSVQDPSKHKLSGASKEYEKSLQKYIFQDATIRGFFLMNLKSKKVETYCIKPGTTDLSPCPSNMTAYVEAAAAASGLAPIRNVASECGAAFGILTVKDSGSVAYKTVANGPGGPEKLGADCSGVSNKAPHLQKIKLLVNEVTKANTAGEQMGLHNDLLAVMYPVINMGETRHITSEEIREAADMTQSVLCIYLEFLCRMMDARRVAGKRWFMNTVEFQRSFESAGSQWPKK